MLKSVLSPNRTAAVVALLALVVAGMLLPAIREWLFVAAFMYAVVWVVAARASAI